MLELPWWGWALWYLAGEAVAYHFTLRFFISQADEDDSNLARDAFLCATFWPIFVPVALAYRAGNRHYEWLQRKEAARRKAIREREELQGQLLAELDALDELPPLPEIQMNRHAD